MENDIREWENVEAAEDEAAEIRYSLTALGEATVAERRGTRFFGFGPCVGAVA